MYSCGGVVKMKFNSSVRVMYETNGVYNFPGQVKEKKNEFHKLNQILQQCRI